jgi:hypothetical protein
MIYIIIYIIGFILTLTFLKMFGKKLGIDYDSPHEPDHDDWQNNAQAYLAFSICWVVTAPMFTVVVIVKLLYKFSQWFLKYPNV